MISFFPDLIYFSHLKSFYSIFFLNLCFLIESHFVMRSSDINKGFVCVEYKKVKKNDGTSKIFVHWSAVLLRHLLLSTQLV